MMQKENIYSLAEIVNGLKPPILIVSTIVGRGMYSIGEALQEMCDDQSQVFHVPIEHMLPKMSINEDVTRYKFISCKLPFLLNLMYKIPIFYERKYIREKSSRPSGCVRLKHKIQEIKAETVICVSHRPAFWTSDLKTKNNLEFKLWGLLGEYGYNPGWKYIFWESMNGFLSPVNRQKLKKIEFPSHVSYHDISLPARKVFHDIAKRKGDPNQVLIVCGYWGQGPIDRIIRMLSERYQRMKIYAVCGENQKLYHSICRSFKGNTRIKVFLTVESLAPLMEKCGCIITKPGISTLIEAYAAQRMIFLLAGMPVAEDNNARYASKHFSAEWFSLDTFKKWHDQQTGVRISNISKTDYWNQIYNDQSTGKTLGFFDKSDLTPVGNPMRRYSFTEKTYLDTIKTLHGNRILSIGGGIDKIALFLASKGNIVQAVDLSDEAAKTTRMLAKTFGVEENLKAYQCDFEHTPITGAFDCVFTHDSLHHMNIRKSVDKVFALLDNGGVWIGMEPICLHRGVQYLHKKIPFHPLTYTEGEKELSRQDIVYMKNRFRCVELSYFDFLTRESIFYSLYKLGFRRFLNKLSRMDSVILRRLPFLKQLSSYIIFRAEK